MLMQCMQEEEEEEEVVVVVGSETNAGRSEISISTARESRRDLRSEMWQEVDGISSGTICRGGHV